MPVNESATCDAIARVCDLHCHRTSLQPLLPSHESATFIAIARVCDLRCPSASLRPSLPVSESATAMPVSESATCDARQRVCDRNARQRVCDRNARQRVCDLHCHRPSLQPAMPVCESATFIARQRVSPPPNIASQVTPLARPEPGCFLRMFLWVELRSDQEKLPAAHLKAGVGPCIDYSGSSTHKHHKTRDDFTCY